MGELHIDIIKRRLLDEFDVEVYLGPLQVQGSHTLEKYLNLEGFLEKSLQIKLAMTSTGKSLRSLEKSLNSTIFCRT